MIWFTSDTHWYHTNIIRYCGRPFKNVDEMNHTMIDNWNNVVRPNDTVYHLGDLGMIKSVDTLYTLLNRLNGKKFLIKGSHDQTYDKICYPFDNNNIISITPMHTIPAHDQANVSHVPITLCHYCLRTWPKSHFNSWHLYGHSHNRLPPEGKSLDVGVDGHNFTPWSLAEVTRYMSERPDNPSRVR